MAGRYNPVINLYIVTSHKGGTGKSLIASALCSTFGQHNKGESICISLDPATPFPLTLLLRSEDNEVGKVIKFNRYMLRDNDKVHIYDVAGTKEKDMMLAVIVSNTALIVASILDIIRQHLQHLEGESTLNVIIDLSPILTFNPKDFSDLLKMLVELLRKEEKVVSRGMRVRIIYLIDTRALALLYDLPDLPKECRNTGNTGGGHGLGQTDIPHTNSFSHVKILDKIHKDFKEVEKIRKQIGDVEIYPILNFYQLDIWKRIEGKIECIADKYIPEDSMKSIEKVNINMQDDTKIISEVTCDVFRNIALFKSNSGKNNAPCTRAAVIRYLHRKNENGEESLLEHLLGEIGRVVDILKLLV
ncbi:hypothetical protein [Pyrodictium abyssi]|uniref:Anion-transporting ATPase-like domain-containing protein n=1 Tax=Pyrodictium abyssi TaxID=54256 RepID=A0ABN6ZNC7_9CREN|nr:hypothetical protein PABY_13190 [Pyrodictium abyssi]